MFKELVAIEPVNLVSQIEGELRGYVGETASYEDVPSGDEKIIRRTGDADAVLVSYTSRISRYVIESCPSIRYIDMRCNLYSEENANVDIACARERGITVLGIRDYGDRGVIEYVLYELVRFLHGFDRPILRGMPVKITGLKVGIIGIGVSGEMIADAMKFIGAGVSYYSRSRKQDREDQGLVYRPLKELLARSGVVFAHLNRNVVLLYGGEFTQPGQGRILFDTSVGPVSDLPALKIWLDQGNNYFICDTEGALRDSTGELIRHPGVFCAHISAGRTKQASDLLSKKVLDNIRTYLNQQQMEPVNG